MNTASWFKSETWDLPRPVWIMISLVFIALAFVITTAGKTAGAAILFAATPPLVLLAGGYALQSTPLSPPLRIATACWCFGLLSIIWSADLPWSAKALTLSGLIITFAHLSQRSYRTMPLDWLEHLSRTALVAFIIFLIYGLIEETFDHQIKRALFWPFQAVQWRDGGPYLDWSHVSYVRPRRTNWNMTTTSFLLWPILMIAAAHLRKQDLRWFLPLTIAATLAMVLQAHHETAMLALIVGIAFYLLALAWRRLALILAAVAWLVAIATVVPISHHAYQQKLHLADWIPYTLRHRIVVWGYTASLIPERPLLGVGAGSTKPLDDARESEWTTVDGTRFQPRTLAQPHNIYLQVWYEFGAIGAVLFSAPRLDGALEHRPPPQDRWPADGCWLHDGGRHVNGKFRPVRTLVCLRNRPDRVPLQSCDDLSGTVRDGLNQAGCDTG